MALFHLKADLTQPPWAKWRYDDANNTEACRDIFVLANTLDECLALAVKFGGAEPPEAWSGDNFTAAKVCETEPMTEAQLVMTSLGQIGGSM